MSLSKNDFDADDLVSDTVLKAFEKFHLLRDRAKIKQWLFRILNNQFISKYRNRKKFIEIPTTETEITGDEMDDFSLFESLSKSDFVAAGNPENKFISKLTMNDINNAIAALPDGFRTALTLCDIEEFSYAEIAKALKIPVGTVRSRVARARIILQKKLWRYAQEMGIKISKHMLKKESLCTCGKTETTQALKLADNIY